MDETEYLLSSAKNEKRLKASIKELEEDTKDDLFGIWADKNQNVDAYVRDIRQLSVMKIGMIMSVGNDKA